MNNNIQEPHCSFEVSKLLKKKEFGVELKHFYYIDFPDKLAESMYLGNHNNASTEVMSAPTHALAIKWIRENYGIHIFTDFGLGWESFIIPVGYSGDGKFMPGLNSGFDTPEEAIEFALKYVLENLIK